ncbi:MAG: hypothetical protein LH628_16520 [Microcoleus sp. CAN_BIN18]|nr:hypothetical protein [Microcoleus sp. CAN_BIN18]
MNFYINSSCTHTNLGVADSGYDSSIMRSLQPWVGAIHELPPLKVSYLNPATPQFNVKLYISRSP